MVAALIDILKNEFDPHQNKLIWVLVVLLMPFLGGILYFAIGQRNKIYMFFFYIFVWVYHWW